MSYDNIKIQMRHFLAIFEHCDGSFRVLTTTSVRFSIVPMSPVSKLNSD